MKFPAGHSNGENIEFPPKPKWKPNLPINIDKIVENAKYYTNHKFQFAVFKHGTVVYFPNRVNNIEFSASSTLDKIYKAHPDFRPLAMDDGNYVVQYSQPAFTIVFKSEIEKHWEYIESNYMEGVCTYEVLLNKHGQGNVFDKIGKICLFGRAKMFMDAQDPKVVIIFDPSLNSA